MCIKNVKFWVNLSTKLGRLGHVYIMNISIVKMFNLRCLSLASYFDIYNW